MTYSIQVNSTFYCAKLIFIWLSPWQFVKYHPQLQFGVHHIAPNLADIAQAHLLGSILIRHCWKKSTAPCTPLNHWLSLWVICLWFPAHIDIPGILLMCFCVTLFLFSVSSQVVPPNRFPPWLWYILHHTCPLNIHPIRQNSPYASGMSKISAIKFKWITVVTEFLFGDFYDYKIKLNSYVGVTKILGKGIAAGNRGRNTGSSQMIAY